MLLRALLAFLILPGVFAGVIPWIIAASDPWRGARHPVALALLGAGAAIVLWCVRDFLVIGRGTLAPWDPPKKLVVEGLYRFVRNPMYVGVIATILGAGFFAGSPLTILYGALVAVTFHVRVLNYEEPVLAAQFGPEWTAYAKAVRRWLPRLAPWLQR